MNIRAKAKGALDDVSTASRRVAETSEAAAVALVATAAVAVVALAVAVVALTRVAGHEH